MKTLYLECYMGAAGDMLMAALLELLPDPDGFLNEINGLGIPGVRVEREKKTLSGIAGTHVRVTVHGEEEESLDVHDHGHDEDGHSHAHSHDHAYDEGGHTHAHNHDDHAHGEDGQPHAHSHDHAHDEDGQPHAHSHDDGYDRAHRSEADIGRVIEGLPVSDGVKAHAKAVYALIAEAEAHAHGRPVGMVHFHEVGALDAVADVVGVSLLIERLAPDRVVVSPVHVGSGQVRCAHGVLPVPAPATAHILRNVPAYGGSVRGELCTPTGAALLKHFAHGFGPMPVMQVGKIGYGMGTKDFGPMNCVRAFWGEVDKAGAPNGEAVELCCNLDDMTGEAAGFVCELLLEHGALDVFTIPVQMKKGRPGFLLSCLCEAKEADRLAALLLAHTTTFGVRRYDCRRYTLERTVSTVETAYGPVRIKTGTGYGAKKSKPEYGDVAAAAKAHGIPLSEVTGAVRRTQDET